MTGPRLAVVAVVVAFGCRGSSPAPSLDLVVAITSRAYGRGYGQRRSQAILLAILAALAPQGEPAAARPPPRGQI